MLLAVICISGLDACAAEEPSCADRDAVSGRSECESGTAFHRCDAEPPQRGGQRLREVNRKRFPTRAPIVWAIGHASTTAGPFLR